MSGLLGLMWQAGESSQFRARTSPDDYRHPVLVRCGSRDTRCMNLSLRSLSRRVPVAAATGAIVLLPAVADAAFPGANGSIVYRSTQQACLLYTSDAADE